MILGQSRRWTGRPSVKPDDNCGSAPFSLLRSHESAARNVLNKADAKCRHLQQSKQYRGASGLASTHRGRPLKTNSDTDRARGANNQCHRNLDWREMSSNDSRPAEQEQPYEHHQSQPDNETGECYPPGKIALTKPQHNWDPKWQSLDLMSQRPVTHSTHDVQRDERGERAIGDCARAGHDRDQYDGTMDLVQFSCVGPWRSASLHCAVTCPAHPSDYNFVAHQSCIGVTFEQYVRHRGLSNCS